ncbi:MAG: DUF6168 family protein [Flavobacteriales bacterium]|nr:DUF6168 family protein [Flavobacteriales bacterium]
MIKAILRFAIVLTAILLFTFAIHAFIQKATLGDPFEHNIIVYYLFNYILTLLFFAMLVYFQSINSKQLGFIFLASSFVKFMLYFVFFKEDSEEATDKVEAMTFFIPYGLSLALETYYLVQMLKNQEKENEPTAD